MIYSNWGGLAINGAAYDCLWVIGTIGMSGIFTLWVIGIIGTDGKFTVWGLGAIISGIYDVEGLYGSNDFCWKWLGIMGIGAKGLIGSMISSTESLICFIYSYLLCLSILYLMRQAYFLLVTLSIYYRTRSYNSFSFNSISGSYWWRWVLLGNNDMAYLASAAKD